MPCSAPNCTHQVNLKVSLSELPADPTATYFCFRHNEASKIKKRASDRRYRESYPERVKQSHQNYYLSRKAEKDKKTIDPTDLRELQQLFELFFIDDNEEGD